MGATLSKKFLSYRKKQVQQLLDRVFHLDFLVDVTQEKYDALSETEKKNGNLYLIHDEEEEEES